MTTEQRDADVALDERIAWLSNVVSRSEFRPKLHCPWTAEIAGEPWTVASDGMRLVALRGALTWAGSTDQPSLDKILDGVGGEILPVNLNDLRAFLGTVAPGVAVPDCRRCGNTGEVRCGNCEESNACACLHATRTDWLDRVRIFGDAFNRNLLTYPLRHLAGESATWQQAEREKVALIDGGDWRLYLMPLRHDDLSDLPTFPAPTTSEKAAVELPALPRP